MEYSVIFRGQVRDGYTPDVVKANLAKLFRQADTSRLDRYFTGSPVTLKSGLNAEAAERYQQALFQAGARCEVEPPLLGAATFAVPEHAPAAPLQPAMAAVWWVMRDQQKLGPYTRDALQEEATAGKLCPGDQVWKAGLKSPVAPASLGWLKVPQWMVPPTVTRVEVNPYSSTVSLTDMESEESPEGPPWVVGVLIVLAILLQALNFLLTAGLQVGHMDRSQALGYALGYTLFAPLVGLAVTWKRSARARTLGFLVGAFITLLMLMVQVAERTQRDMHKPHDINAELREGVAQANRKLPTMIDADTRADELVAGDMLVTKKMTFVHLSSTQVDSMKFAELARPKLIKDACSDKFSIKLLQQGVKMSFIYSGNDGHEIGEIFVNPSDCGVVGH